MKSVRSALTKRRRILTSEVTPHNENRTLTGMEEMYWFAMALTGDPDLAAQLVVDAGNISSKDRGIFRD